MRTTRKPPAYWSTYPAEAPHTVTGDLRWWRRCPLTPLAGRRPVTVWLPPTYMTEDRSYPVLYMLDAQNLFDTQTSYAGHEWQVDESMQALADEGHEAIVVAVNHAGKRRVDEYTPYARVGGQGEEFLDFLGGPLKVRIDRDFRTLPEREQTWIAGSSMGGLISLFAFFRRPHIFGGAAAFSPALWIAGGAIYETVGESPHVDGRIYLDCGTREPTVRPMADLLRRKGYRPGESLYYVREPGARHEEAAWARRFPAAVRFLFGAMGA